MANGSFLLAGFFGALAWIYFSEKRRYASLGLAILGIGCYCSGIGQWLAAPSSIRPDAVVFVFSLMLGTPLLGAGAGFLTLIAARALRPRFHAWGRRTLESVRAKRAASGARRPRGLIIRAGPRSWAGSRPGAWSPAAAGAA